MLRWLRAATLAWLLALTAGHCEAADRRVALVIGNANYTASGVPPLANAASDARAVADSLKSLGFQPELALNQSYRALRDTVQRFAGQANGADVAMVFYAGHGLELGG